MQLFKCQTIPQFKIQQFLMSEGLAREAIKDYEFLDRETVRITDFVGSSMTVHLESPGVYLFTYLIHGVTSTERRTDPAECHSEDAS